MMRIAICDDEPEARACLASLVRAQDRPCEIVEYASAGECLADRRDFDLLFLDVELSPSGGGPDGVALARALGERAVRPVVVFVTGYDRYVFDAFDVGAFQYLLKPVDGERFARVFSRAEAEIASGPAARVRTITLQYGGASRTLPLDGIRYAESSGHKVRLHLRDGEEFVCYARLQDLEDQLRGRFFRIHKGYLVNLSYVEGYSKTEVSLAGGERLLLSKYKYQDFVKAYLRFLKGGAGS